MDERTQDRKIHESLTKLLEQARLRRATGRGYLRIDFNQGTPCEAASNLEEKFPLKD